MALIDLANPTRFVALVERVLPWLIGATVLAFAIGLRGAFLAPDDYQQGATVQDHVHPRAQCVASHVRLGDDERSPRSARWCGAIRSPTSPRNARRPLGAAFTFLALVTGSLWGRPMWGTYWVWDARLTSVLVLFLMYLGLIALWRTIDDPARAGRAAAILTLVGAVNLPIIKFSVDWWNTLHQPASVFRMGGPTIDASLLAPLFVMAHRLHAAVPHPASRGDAQRDHAPAGPHAAADPSRARLRGSPWISDRTPTSSSPPILVAIAVVAVAGRLGVGRLFRAEARARRSRTPRHHATVGRAAAVRSEGAGMTAVENPPAVGRRRLLVLLPLVALPRRWRRCSSSGSAPAIPRACPRR